MAEYETYEADDDTYREERPRVAVKRRKSKAYTPVRCPYCFISLTVFDTELPDEKIEGHIAAGECSWLEKNDPTKAEAIRVAHYRVMESRERPKSRGRR